MLHYTHTTEMKLSPSPRSRSQSGHNKSTSSTLVNSLLSARNTLFCLFVCLKYICFGSSYIFSLLDAYSLSLFFFFHSDIIRCADDR